MQRAAEILRLKSGAFVCRTLWIEPNRHAAKDDGGQRWPPMLLRFEILNVLRRICHQGNLVIALAPSRKGIRQLLPLASSRSRTLPLRRGHACGPLPVGLHPYNPVSSIACSLESLQSGAGPSRISKFFRPGVYRRTGVMVISQIGHSSSLEGTLVWRLSRFCPSMVVLLVLPAHQRGL